MSSQFTSKAHWSACTACAVVECRGEMSCICPLNGHYFAHVGVSSTGAWYTKCQAMLVLTMLFHHTTIQPQVSLLALICCPGLRVRTSILCCTNRKVTWCWTHFLYQCKLYSCCVSMEEPTGRLPSLEGLSRLNESTAPLPPCGSIARSRYGFNVSRRDSTSNLGTRSAPLVQSQYEATAVLYVCACSCNDPFLWLCTYGCKAGPSLAKVHLLVSCLHAPQCTMARPSLCAWPGAIIHALALYPYCVR